MPAGRKASVSRQGDLFDAKNMFPDLGEELVRKCQLLPANDFKEVERNMESFPYSRSITLQLSALFS